MIFAIRFVDEIEARIERAGFARTGRARYEQDSIRQTKQTLECFLVVTEKSKLGEAQHKARFVENAQDDAFAVVGGNRRDAKVDRLARDPHLDASVLRQTLFRDAHRAGHDFQPADDGGLQSFRRRLHFLKDAIDSKPDAKFLVERLEVNITGAKPMRFDEEHRDHANDRRVFVGVTAAVAAFHDLEAEIHVLAGLLHQDVGRLIGRAIVFDQGLSDFLRARADQFDLALQQEAQAIDRVDVERVPNRHDQSGFAEADRNDFEPPRIRRVNLADHLRWDERRRKIDPIHLSLRGEIA